MAVHTTRRLKSVNLSRNSITNNLSGNDVVITGFTALLDKLVYSGTGKKQTKISREKNNSLSSFISVIDGQLYLKSQKFNDLKQTRIFKVIQFAGIAILVVGLVIGAWFYYENYKSNQIADDLIGTSQGGALDDGAPSGNTDNSNDNSVFVPTTNKPSFEDVMAHKSPANQPKRIEINKIDIFARVSEVGNNNKGEVGVPADVYDASWYSFSSEVGKIPGASVIVGHVGFRSIEGVFSKIDELNAGDMIAITMGDDRIFNYLVTKNESLKLDNFSMSNYLSYNDQNNSTLHLITCSGSILRGSTSYDSRLVVSAVLQN